MILKSACRSPLPDEQCHQFPLERWSLHCWWAAKQTRKTIKSFSLLRLQGNDTTAHPRFLQKRKYNSPAKCPRLMMKAHSTVSLCSGTLRVLNKNQTRDSGEKPGEDDTRGGWQEEAAVLSVWLVSVWKTRKRRGEVVRGRGSEMLEWEEDERGWKDEVGGTALSFLEEKKIIKR